MTNAVRLTILFRVRSSFASSNPLFALKRLLPISSGTTRMVSDFFFSGIFLCILWLVLQTVTTEYTEDTK